MGSDDNSDSESKRQDPDIASDSEGRVSRQASNYATEDDEELNIQLGPKVSIREHLEKDKVYTGITFFIITDFLLHNGTFTYISVMHASWMNDMCFIIMCHSL